SKLGFQVITAETTARDAMQKSILEFASRLEGETTGLFYYAGHGIQSRGRNYLLPVDAEVSSERALRFEAVDVQAVLEEMEFAGNRINIVILDACRNNPFERRFRGGSRGLAAIDAARGILIAYATAPGAVAADGDGDNGLYTAELLAALQVPNLKVEEVFKRVRVAVTARTGGAQVPWESSSLTGDLVFNRQKSAAQGASPAPARISNHEAIFWETIQDSDNPEDFRAYLRQYPQGTFASLALIRVSAMEETARGTEITAAIDSGDAAASTVVSPPSYTVQLKVALLAFEGWHVWGYLDNALRNTQKRVTYVIRNDSRLHLVYAQHDPRADADRFWEG
ncbi:MAG: caspase family protein, partial [Gammaproteobacteria bacterium]|nr:caspase family protein [Gammaproteobacteria bacterium]